MRKMRDTFLGAPPLGDVFDRGYPSARIQRLVYDQDRSAAWSPRDLMSNFPEPHVADDGAAKFVNIAVKGPGLFSMRDQLPHGAAGLGHVRGQPKHLDIALVANGNPRLRVVNHQALRNIVNGGVEALLLRLMLLRQLANDEKQHDRDHE